MFRLISAIIREIQLEAKTRVFIHDQPVAECATYTNTRNRDKHPCPQRNSNPHPQQSNCCKPAPYVPRPQKSASSFFTFRLLGQNYVSFWTTPPRVTNYTHVTLLSFTNLTLIVKLLPLITHVHYIVCKSIQHTLRSFSSHLTWTTSAMLSSSRTFRRVKALDNYLRHCNIKLQRVQLDVGHIHKFWLSANDNGNSKNVLYQSMISATKKVLWCRRSKSRKAGKCKFELQHARPPSCNIVRTAEKSGFWYVAAHVRQCACLRAAEIQHRKNLKILFKEPKIRLCWCILGEKY